MDSGDEGSPPSGEAVVQLGEIDASRVRDVGAAIAAGVAAGNVEVAGEDAETMDLPDTMDEDERKRQEKLLAEVEARRRLQAMIVPTDDGDVRHKLRALGEPVTLFGEGKMERRDRLRKLMLGAAEEGRDLSGLLGDATVVDKEVVQNELFYTEGPQELLKAREAIAQYSLGRARTRVEGQKRRLADPDEDESAEADAVTAACKRLANECSELGDDRPIQSCAFSPDATTLAAAGWGGHLKLWEAPSCKQKLHIRAADERLTGVAWHPEAGLSLSPELINLGAACADGNAYLFSATGKKLVTLQGHTARLARCRFHPMGHHFGTASFDKSWILWDLYTGQALLEQEGHSRPVYGLAFQGDGSLAVSGGLDAMARLWDLRTGRSIHVLRGHAKGILSCDFHPNGYHVATAGLDHSVRVWDLRKRECLYNVPAHRHLVSEVRYEPSDGHYFVTSGYDKLVKVWSSKTFGLVSILAGHENKVMSADVAPDGSGLIASVAYDRTLKFWLPEPDLDDANAGGDGDGDGPAPMEA
mmetsp:Transcript_33197/g.86094  ORF Transcript_33197/g.86094 Transcript_33197/m.86094 type:complete len:529 (-) Transcript_33197:43-1629(-)